MRERFVQYAPLTLIVGALLLLIALGLFVFTQQFDTRVEALLAAGLVAIALFFLLDPASVRRALGTRQAKYGGNAAVMIVVFVGILVVINLLSGRHHTQFDLTAMKEHTLSPQTLQVLASLKEPVRITGFFQGGDPGQEDLTNWLKLYTQHTDKISYTFVDPDAKPALARQYNITGYGTVVYESGTQRQDSLGTDEQDITSAILKVTNPKQKKIYLLTGHGERDPDSLDQPGYSQAKEALEHENYKVEALNLTTSKEPQIPADAAVVIIAAPQTPLLDPEAKALTTYLDQGGKTLILDDPASKAQLNGLLAQYGVRFDNDILIDPASALLGDAASVLVTRYQFSQITKNLPETFFPQARSIRQVDSPPEGVTFTPLAVSSDQSWGEIDLQNLQVRYEEGKDIKGPLAVVASIEAAVKTSASPT
jgi:ABC-type uncharacterized transport system involved in gliding motility auxiliary subunit